MSKPYREADLSDQLAQDRNWRLKEISNLKSAILRADRALQPVLLRALVAICYAHWEGSVRFSARKFMEYVAIRKLQYASLNRQFLRNHFLIRLASLSVAKTSVSDRCRLIDDVLEASNRRFSRADDEIINTRANLSFSVFLDICRVCGVSEGLFSDNEIFVDVVLLKRRNSIAHGEETFIELEDLDTIASQTISIMRVFGEALENHIYTRAYLST